MFELVFVNCKLNNECPRNQKHTTLIKNGKEFFFTSVKETCICLICRAKVALAKRGNLERHYKTIHKNHQKDFPPNSELRESKLKNLKLGLAGEQTMFTRPLEKSKAATMASYKICHMLAKHKKPFEDGIMIKECFIEAADSLFGNFKNKTEIISAIKDLKLSRQTVTRRIEIINQNLHNQTMKDLEECTNFSLQIDESTDATDGAQLCIFIRMVFPDMSVRLPNNDYFERDHSWSRHLQCISAIRTEF